MSGNAVVYPPELIDRAIQLVGRKWRAVERMREGDPLASRTVFNYLKKKYGYRYYAGLQQRLGEAVSYDPESDTFVFDEEVARKIVQADNQISALESLMRDMRQQVIAG